MTLVEVLLVVVISAIVVGPLMAWAVLSMRQESNVRELNTDTAGLGLANVYFPRDVANSSKALVLSSAQIAAGVTLPDCTGGTNGSQASGSVKVALVTPAGRLIVYKTTAGPVTSPDGDVMWRRECPNDPTAVAPAGSGLPDGVGGSALLTSLLVTERIDQLDSSCPAPTAGATHDIDDSLCWSVKLSAKLKDRAKPAVLQASRRINTDTAPGSPPMARLSYLPAMPSTCSGLTVDASRSVDPFDEGFTNFAWTVTKFNPATGLWEPFLSLPSETSPTKTLPPATFTSKGDYRVELTVTAGSAATPQGARTGSTGQVVSFGDCVPTTAITGLWIGSTVGSPGSNLFSLPSTPTVMIGRPFTVTGNVTSPDATPNPSLPDSGALRYEWQWGENDGSGNPLGTGQQIVTTADCPGSRVTGTCSVTATNGAGFSELGVKQIQLLVTDAQGRTATYMRTVNVITNALYISKSGTDSTTCGSAGAPCATLTQGFANAKTQGKTVVRVSAGKQGASYSSYEYSGIELNASNVGVPLTVDGGYELTSSGGWVTTSDHRPIIRGSSGVSTTGLLLNGPITVTLDHLDVRSGSATGSGASAYGIRVINQANVTVRNSKLTASDGAQGGDGSTPTGSLTTGTVGTNGMSGSRHGVPGGAIHGTGVNDGGNGGDGEGKAGINGANGGGGGAGGCNNCRSNSNYSGGGAAGGVAGSAGSSGTKGAGGTASTTAYGVTFAPPAAPSGANGGAGGGGGGGGGGGRACDNFWCAGDWTGGGAGGGGGGGGAGGGGGGGGAGGCDTVCFAFFFCGSEGDTPSSQRSELVVLAP